MSESLKLLISWQDRSRKEVENALHEYSNCLKIKNVSRNRLIDAKVQLETPLKLLQLSTIELIDEIQDCGGNGLLALLNKH